MGWRLVVPVAVERDIPREVAENLYVIGRVHIEVHAPGYRYRRENTSGDVQVGLVETEKFRVRGDHGSGNVLRALCDRGLVVVRILPSKTTEYRDAGVVAVLQITSDATTQIGLKPDVLLRTLQKVTKTCVEPIVPAQQAEVV